MKKGWVAGKLAGFIALAALAWSGPGHAATYHVDAATGDDTKSGDAPAAAWKTMERACLAVKPGDTVIVHPGVYTESVPLTRPGTAQQPIRIQADSVERNRVIISGADPEIRAGRVPWKLEDAELQLYSIPLAHSPACVLSDEVDLFPYKSIVALRSLTTAPRIPGPRHGFFWDAETKRLFVRLHTGGKHGDRNPAKHTMKVSPPTGGGGGTRHVNTPEHYNFGVLTNGPAHVILDGFTFETPGVAGVHLRASDVTVRNCWFIGCRTGVSGATDAPAPDERRSNRITIEQCDFSRFPTFDDIEEVVTLARADKSLQRPNFYWWHRKGGPLTYELGLAIKIGDGWVIRRNNIHDAFDGISVWGSGTSRDLRIEENRFERLADNAAEVENRATNMRVKGNLLVDVYVPFSYQPQLGVPWPGPIYIEDNVAVSSPRGSALWPRLDWIPGAFKIAIDDDKWAPEQAAKIPKNWFAASGEGFVVRRNTVHMPAGNLFIFGGLLKNPAANFTFASNILVVHDRNLPVYRNVDLSGFKFTGNFVSPDVPGAPGPGSEARGEGGRAFDNPGEIGFADFERGDFSLRNKSLAVGASGRIFPTGPISR